VCQRLPIEADTTSAAKFVPGPGIYKLDFCFDIERLRQALGQVLAGAQFTGDAVQAIFLTKVPKDEMSTGGDNIRGQYWTRPDSSYTEVARQIPLDERKYSEFASEFTDTYLYEVYSCLLRHCDMGRVRLLRMKPRSTLSFHREPEPRLHIPIITNPGAIMVVNNHATHLPADGSVYLIDTRAYHNAFNGGEEDRIHFVASLPQ
jgi:hypothetical protein